MTLPEQTQNNRAWHVIGLVCGVLAIASLFLMPSTLTGVVGYLVGIVIAVAAVLVGHASVRRRGAFRAVAIVGLILAYLGLVMFAGLLMVRLTRMFVG